MKCTVVIFRERVVQVSYVGSGKPLVFQ